MKVIYKEKAAEKEKKNNKKAKQKTKVGLKPPAPPSKIRIKITIDNIRKEKL